MKWRKTRGMTLQRGHLPRADSCREASRPEQPPRRPTLAALVVRGVVRQFKIDEPSFHRGRDQTHPEQLSDFQYR